MSRPGADGSLRWLLRQCHVGHTFCPVGFTHDCWTGMSISSSEAPSSSPGGDPTSMTRSASGGYAHSHGAGRSWCRYWHCPGSNSLSHAPEASTTYPLDLLGCPIFGVHPPPPLREALHSWQGRIEAGLYLSVGPPHPRPVSGGDGRRCWRRAHAADSFKIRSGRWPVRAPPPYWLTWATSRRCLTRVMRLFSVILALTTFTPLQLKSTGAGPRVHRRQMCPRGASLGATFGSRRILGRRS